MKKGLLFLLSTLSFVVAFSQDKPKNASTELVQIKVEPQRMPKTQSIKSAGNAKTGIVVRNKQTPKRKDANTTPRKAEMHAVPVKKKINQENNK